MKVLLLVGFVAMAFLVYGQAVPGKAFSTGAGGMNWKAVTSIKPGALWLDTNGDTINAHGGGILFHGGIYYWYGETRGRSASRGVNVYSSSDLMNWKKEGLALAQVQDTTSDITIGCVMERPKVIYNASTGKFVMWFHLELKGKGYSAARAGVAVSNTPSGPFQYLGSFRPNNNMSRDMTLYVDEDGSAYHIYSSRENYDLRIAKLSDDYLAPTKKDSLLFSNHREAPAVFRRNSKYYLVTSGCTGWAPNKASMHVADDLFGPWKLIGDPIEEPAESLTFGGQSTYILQVQGQKDAFIFMADKWKPKDLKDSRYLWLPIQFRDDVPYVAWVDEWNPGFFKEK